MDHPAILSLHATIHSTSGILYLRGIQWGGYIKNNCINVGTVVVTKEDKKKPYGGGYSTLGEPAAEGAPEAAPEAAPEVVPVEA